LRDIVIGSDGGVSHFFVSDDKGPNDLTVSVTSSNQTLISNNSLNLISSGLSNSVELIPEQGQLGSTTITITASDGVHEVTESFLVTVVNQSPQLTFSGQVNNGGWEQLGIDIDGESAGDLSGESVALSANGFIVAIGAILNEEGGSTRVYQYNELSNGWDQLGSDIDGEAVGDQSGKSVALSDDGFTVAIGAILNDGNGDNSGHARIYRYNKIAGQWEQLGSDIDGEAEGDRLGESISLSADG